MNDDTFAALLPSQFCASIRKEGNLDGVSQSHLAVATLSEQNISKVRFDESFEVRMSVDALAAIQTCGHAWTSLR